MENQRTGSTNRINPDRFFHVMNQGWYVFTREGITGPYDRRNNAESFITSLLGDSNPNTKIGIDDTSSNDPNDSNDSNNSWRM